MVKQLDRPLGLLQHSIHIVVLSLVGIELANPGRGGGRGEGGGGVNRSFAQRRLC